LLTRPRTWTDGLRESSLALAKYLGEVFNRTVENSVEKRPRHYAKGTKIKGSLLFAPMKVQSSWQSRKSLLIGACLESHLQRKSTPKDQTSDDARRMTFSNVTCGTSGPTVISAELVIVRGLAFTQAQSVSSYAKRGLQFPARRFAWHALVNFLLMAIESVN